MIRKKKPKTKGKKAVSVIVSYVLLISLVLGMSALVYAWLKSKVPGLVPKENCPEGISLVLESYNCITGNGDGAQKYINLTVKNRGLHTVNGFVVKMSNSSRGLAGMYPLCIVGITPCETGNNVIIHNITPLGTADDTYAERFDYTERNTIKQIEIEPIWKDIYCEKAIITQAVECL